jgi:hypothetical protein
VRVIESPSRDCPYYQTPQDMAWVRQNERLSLSKDIFTSVIATEKLPFLERDGDSDWFE